MTKLEMAQRFAEIMLKTGLQGHWDLSDNCYHSIAQDAWILADAMQAEDDKRIDKSLPSVLTGDDINKAENVLNSIVSNPLK